ncbi:MAG: tetratricopeptide repeat protein [Verrucomicrobia bacterium]|nr:tetratricopeptide repeat protein [Verrucomicrobiota bacterium]
MARPAKTSTSVFSPKLLFAVPVICAIIALWLIPTQHGLLERHLVDKNWGRALKTLQELPAKDRARDPRRYALLEIQLERRLLAADDPRALASLLARACELAAPFKFTPEFMQEITALLDQSQDAEAVWKLLEPVLPQLPVAVRASLYEALVKKALAAAKPVLAMQIYAPHWQQNPDVATTLRLVALTRQAGLPALGLRAVDEFARRTGRPLVRASPRLAWERVTLLRETGQPGLAYEAIRELMTVVEPADRDRLFGLLMTTARESDRIRELLPEIQKRAAAQPENLQLWQMLAELSLASGDQKTAIAAFRQIVALEPNVAANHQRLAQFYEWTALPNDAFDHYLIALRLREPAAIERLIALAPGLYRDADLAKSLADAGNLIDRKKHAPFLARLEATIGNFEQAEAYYLSLVRDPNASVTLLTEYSRLLMDLAHYDRALPVLLRLQKRQPEDVATLGELAECHFRLGDYTKALALYQQLVRRAPDKATVEGFLTLAESMGELAVAADGLEYWLGRHPEPTARDYQRLAYFQGIAGRKEKLREALQRGVERFPQDTTLRRQLVYSLSDQGQFSAAADVLRAHPELRSDDELTKFYLSLLLQAKRLADAEQFVTRELTPELVEKLGLIATVAGVYEASGNWQSALTLYEKLHRMDAANTSHGLAYARLLVRASRQREALAVLQRYLDPPTPATHELAAQLLAATRDFKRAAIHQRAFVASQPEDAGRAWGFLGDILSARGDKLGARVAYQRAIQEMLRSLARM